MRFSLFYYNHAFYISSVQSLSRVWLFVTPWITARQVSLSITNSWSLLKLMSIKSVMPSNHLILCRPLLLLPPVPPSIRVFSNESTLHMSFSFSISPSNEHPGLISFRMDWLDLLALVDNYYYSKEMMLWYKTYLLTLLTDNYILKILLNFCELKWNRHQKWGEIELGPCDEFPIPTLINYTLCKK